jgi:hypothetical protein
VRKLFDSYRGHSLFSKSIRLGLVALGGLFLAAGSARASVQLFQFQPIPISPGVNEFSFDSTSGFTEGPGSVGNGDGAMPVASQTPGGLQAVTPLTIPGVPGSFIDSSGNTTFYDVTLHMGNMTPITGAADVTLLGNAEQLLNTGTFSFTDTSGTVVLLQGTITSAIISGQNGGDAGAFFKSFGVNYTGGVIASALASLAGSGALIGNSVSYTLLDTTPTFGISNNGLPSALMNNFVADGSGQFNVDGVTIIQPEPSVLALAGVAVATLTRRGKRSAR